MKLTQFKAPFVATLAASIALFSASAIASGDVAKERQDLMKNVGAATGAGAAMVKGEVEFNAVAAQLVLRTMNNGGLAFGYMFPEGSEKGANTEAGPAIWSDRAGFDAAVNKFVADTSATVTDLDSFKAAFGAATANCGACHKAYRVKN
jgi:cytochrome c556